MNSPWKPPKITGASPGFESDWQRVFLCPGCLYVISHIKPFTTVGKKCTDLSKGWEDMGRRVSYCSRCGHAANLWILAHSSQPNHRHWDISTVVIVVARYRRPTVQWYNPPSWFDGGHWQVRESDWPLLSAVVDGKENDDAV